MTCITVDPASFGATREAVRLTIEAENVEARPVWKPMHLQPVFASCRALGGRLSEEIFEKGLRLPSGSSLTGDDRSRVIDVVRRGGAEVRA